MVVGTCSICGGMVTVPDNWCCVIPAVPRCEQCGAEAASHGPVIPMRPATRRAQEIIPEKMYEKSLTAADPAGSIPS